MPRLQAIDPTTAMGKSKELLDGVQTKLGMTPNLMRTMANSPAVLAAYLGFSNALAGGRLRAKLREQIALTVSEANDCNYCRAAHSAVGETLGLSGEELLDSRKATAADPKVDAALRFARELVEKEGWVSDENIALVRDAGYGDGEIAEIVANVALTIFTNYFNHVADTELDFPVAESLTATA